MPQHVCNGAVTACTFGLAPSTLIVLPINRVLTSSQPAATIMDHVPMVNITPFGMCMAPANPAVITATAAALGVLTPMPCVPVTPAPWVPGSPTVLEGNFPVLNNTSQLMCVWAGVITITVPGQFTEMVP
ncbi:MAG: DUF4280 domain-containing protein [Janthinobacterium lividum]